MAKTDLIWAREETMNSLLTNLILSNPDASRFGKSATAEPPAIGADSKSLYSLLFSIIVC